MKILFLCVHNSARSQIAEGLAKAIFPSADIQSAGSEPANKVNPHAVKVLSEVGIDISKHCPKTWESLPTDFVNNLNYVITLCAEEVCPRITSNATRLHWGLPDPAAVLGTEEERTAAFRKTREDIKQRLEELKLKTMQ